MEGCMEARVRMQLTVLTRDSQADHALDKGEIRELDLALDR